MEIIYTAFAVGICGRGRLLGQVILCTDCLMDNSDLTRDYVCNFTIVSKRSEINSAASLLSGLGTEESRSLNSENVIGSTQK